MPKRSSLEMVRWTISLAYGQPLLTFRNPDGLREKLEPSCLPALAFARAFAGQSPVGDCFLRLTPPASSVAHGKGGL
jgi:hypothetical protein